MVSEPHIRSRFAGQENRGFCTLAEGEGRRLRARAIVIGDVRVTVPGIPICSTSEALQAPRLCVRELARSPLFAYLPIPVPPLFVLLVDLHAYGGDHARE